MASLLYAEHFLLGADRLYLALGFCAAWFAALSLLIIASPWARQTLDELPIAAPGLLFAAVLAAAAVSLTGLGVGGPHPAWSLAPDARPTVTIDPYGTWVEMLKLAALAAAFLVGASFGGDDDRARQLIRAIQYGGIIYSLLAFLQQVFAPRLLFGGMLTYDPTRLCATLFSPNTAATLFSALSLLNLAELLRRLERERKEGDFHAGDIEPLIQKLSMPVISLGLTLVCLVMTVSRSGMTAFAVAAMFLIMAVSIAQSKRRAAVQRVMIVAIIGGLIILGFALNSQRLADRSQNLGVDLSLRSHAYVEHWKAFLAAPWQGYGLGTMTHVNGMIMNAANLIALDSLGAVHNVYIQWLEQAGVIGAAPMFLLIAVIAFQIVRGVFKRRRMRVWMITILAVLVLFLVHGATDFALEIPSMATLLSLLLGVGYRLARPA